ncbi:hypothetical protein G9A89_007012 [Geosiphon pyriformis]|nr:hypothetical protein G9A89_007012 [Geosiphon pyriformis]
MSSNDQSGKTQITTTYFTEDGTVNSTHMTEKENQNPKVTELSQLIENESQTKNEKGFEKNTNDDDDDDDNESKAEAKPPPVSFIQLFRFADSWDIFLMIIGSLAAVANGSSIPVMTIIFSNFLTAFGEFTLSNAQNPENLQDHRDRLHDAVMKNVIYFIIQGIATFIAAYVQMACWMIAGERQTKRIREKYYAAVLRQDISWFDVMSSGDLTTRISGDTNLVQEGMSDKVGNIIQSLTTFFAGFIIGFIKGWKLALVLSAVMPLLALAGGAMAKALSSSSTEGQGAYAGAGTVAEQAISGIKTVVAFGGEKREIARYIRQLDIAYIAGKRKALISGIGLGLIFFIMFASYGLGFWYGSKLVLSHEKTGPEVLNTFLSVIMGAMFLGNAAPHFASIGNACGAAAALFAVIDRVPLIDVNSSNGKKLSKSTVKGKIEIKNVNFHYPQRPDVPVLKNFNLSIEAGQTVALVGSSGSGKSTIIGLMERFYDPIEGSIFVDGNNIQDINIKSLRTLIGLVGQEPVLFPATIAQNIKWGGMVDEKEPTLEEVIEACKKSNAHEFINELPDKYDSLVGEKGALMSGGQKQRIAIARALIKDPSILLLDEATSALDTESERLVQDALDTAATNRTTIVIAHRLSTIKNADKIVVMRKGEIVEIGQHEELIKNQGLYFELVKAQEMKLKDSRKKSVRINVADDEEDDDDDDSTSTRTGDEKDESAVTVDGKKHHGHLVRRMSTKGTILSQKDLDNIRAEEEKEALKKNAPFKRVAALNSKEWHLILFGLSGAATYGAVMPLYALVFTNIMDVFSRTDQPDKLRRDSNMYSLLFVLLGVVGFVSNFAQMFGLTLNGERLTRRIRRMTFEALMRQEVGFFDEVKNTTGILTSKLAVDASKVEGLSGSLFGTVIQIFVGLSLGLAEAFYYGWKLSLVVLATIPFIMLAGILQMKAIAGYGAKTSKAYEFSGQVVQQSVSNMRTIAALSREETFKSMYRQAISEPHKTAIKGTLYSSVGFGFGQSLIYFTWALAFWYGSTLLSSLEYTQKQMLSVLFALIFSAFGLGQISSFAPNVAKAKVAAISTFAIIDRKSAIDVKDTLLKDRPTPVNGSASIEHARFSYPARPDLPVLRGLDINVLSGKTVAIVGSSGSGKSTVVSLLLRYYDISAGHINVENVDVREWNLEYLRSHMALVGQEPVLFNLTIGENIAYGKEGCSQEEIIEAAKQANIHNFIDSLPEKYDTKVGEKGSQLSGGQKQRVAIARALIRSPRFLLLDEATSALDSESEKVVQEALDRASKGRTTITIAHRLSTIQDADLIVVVKKGQVVEQGKHMDLIAQKGFYHELVKKQTLMKQESSNV